ncbi:MAG: VWA domain-containing protein [Acidobacteriota bacterium]
MPAGFLTGASATGQADPASYEVRLLSPAEDSYLGGPTRFHAEVRFPDSDPIARVEFYVDDVRVATVLRPPYRADWDAGPGFEPHRVRVVAVSASGVRARAEVRTRRLVPDQTTEVRVVNIYATVRKKGRGFITDLEASDFIIEENGVPQTITHFSRDVRSVHWAILLDVSASMHGARLKTARKAALLFLEALGAQDHAMVLTFSDVIDSTPLVGGDFSALRQKILSARAEGGTALYDSLVEAAERLREADGKKAFLLLSDGRDQGMDGYGPGSQHTFEEALERVQRAGVAVYAVGLGKDLESQLDFRRRRSLRQLLEELADDTGGRAYMVRRQGGLRATFRQVAREVRMQYSIGYSPTDTRRDGSWRNLVVRTRDPQQEVVARRGYFAPGGGS